jgi:hypothetical protein
MIPFKCRVVGEHMGLPIISVTYLYAGRWRTAQGIANHRAGRRRRHQDPVDRIKSDIASNAAKRERMVDGSGTQREV